MIRQHPFQDIYSLFDSMIPDTMMPARRTRFSDTVQSTGMPLDVYATDEQAVVLASVPGMSPEDLNVTVKKDTVTISGSLKGERRQEDEQGKPVTWYFSEIPRGSYERQLRMPFAIAEDKVEAQFAHGMLRIVLPRADTATAHQIDVRVMDSRFPEIATESTQTEAEEE